MTIETMNLPISRFQAGAAVSDDLDRPKRNVWLSLRRGFTGHCPSCGIGALYSKYLKVNDRCADCGAELFHQRADDAPPYVTMLVVGHIIGAMILSADTMFPDFPVLYQLILWPILTVGLCLALLPAFKGALVGYQWALRMHGFDSAADAASAGARPHG
jgi:uncharacterized protein (DUF983 family)